MSLFYLIFFSSDITLISYVPGLISEQKHIGSFADLKHLFQVIHDDLFSLHILKKLLMDYIQFHFSM